MSRQREWRGRKSIQAQAILELVCKETYYEVSAVCFFLWSKLGNSTNFNSQISRADNTLENLLPYWRPEANKPPAKNGKHAGRRRLVRYRHHAISRRFDHFSNCDPYFPISIVPSVDQSVFTTGCTFPNECTKDSKEILALESWL